MPDLCSSCSTFSIKMIFPFSIQGRMNVGKGMLSWELGSKDSKRESPRKMASHSRASQSGELYIQTGKGQWEWGSTGCFEAQSPEISGNSAGQQGQGERAVPRREAFGHQELMESWPWEVATKVTAELPLASSAWRGGERAEERWASPEILEGGSHRGDK